MELRAREKLNKTFEGRLNNRNRGGKVIASFSRSNVVEISKETSEGSRSS